MSKTEKEYREEIVEVGRLVWQKGWVAANDGNISLRLDENRVLCTPTGVCKGMMRPDDLIVCDAQGVKIEGARERTTEIAMHMTIYRLRPDVCAVVHAHPPVATGFATAGRPLNLALLPEMIVGLGTVPLAHYGLPGTPALTEGMLPLIPNYDAILLANHGAVSYGDSLQQAFFRMDTVEHLARIALVAELVGGPTLLPKTEVAKLFDSRARYGVVSRNTMEPGNPVVAEDVKSNDSAPRRELPRHDLSDREASDNGHWDLTRDEIIALIEEALRARRLVTH